MSEQPHHILEEQEEERKPKRKRICYTSELKLKLIQLCIQNGNRYIETVPEDDFWSYIRTLFLSMLECNTNTRNGISIHRKVADISGVAIAPPTDLEQAINT
ncbi:hypothetical protein L211DRAFT_853979 [Terfezia boudieri ATCC MYA-4762]|uniref:Uncharacterized protein n=1 Tax=Terfezia boudieri ATCC MYA-4762 TaxID=1051890 RepID=A0A3N4L7M5_9PEZI|nr:hypothetical protein L211DRAFT_853979 [Terfezia boudieri ATCC MYA-4762]